MNQFSQFLHRWKRINCQEKQCNISHFTLTLVPHYIGKFQILICLKKQNICTVCWSIVRIRGL